jgi:hypothetical protein
MLCSSRAFFERLMFFFISLLFLLPMPYRTRTFLCTVEWARPQKMRVRGRILLGSTGSTSLTITCPSVPTHLFFCFV